MLTQGFASKQQLITKANHFHVNSGFGQNYTLPIALTSAAIPSLASAFADRFTTAIGDADCNGIEFMEDASVWTHGNGNRYFGSVWYDRFPAGCGSAYNNCAADKVAGTANNTCRDRDGNPDDRHPLGNYMKCCVSNNFVGNLGIIYAYPRLTAMYRATDDAGKPWFDLVERWETVGIDTGSGPPSYTALTHTTSDHACVDCINMYLAIADCSRTLTGSDDGVKVDTFSADCVGHPSGVVAVVPGAGITPTGASLQ